jgi:Flp pilus assembly pilin Flp
LNWHIALIPVGGKLGLVERKRGRNMKRLMRQFQVNDDATTSVEYAVMLALILLVVITAVASFGSGQNSFWGRIDSQMKSHGID